MLIACHMYNTFQRKSQTRNIKSTKMYDRLVLWVWSNISGLCLVRDSLGFVEYIPLLSTISMCSHRNGEGGGVGEGEGDIEDINMTCNKQDYLLYIAY